MLKCLNCLPSLLTHHFPSEMPSLPPAPPLTQTLCPKLTNITELLGAPLNDKIYSYYFQNMFSLLKVETEKSTTCIFLILASTATVWICHILYSPEFISPFPNDRSRRCLRISSNCEFIIFQILYSPPPASPNDRIGIIACSDRGQWCLYCNSALLLVVLLVE